MLAGLVGFPLLLGALAMPTGDWLALPLSVLVYLLSLYLYRGTASMAFAGHVRLLLYVGALSVGLAAVVVPSSVRMIMVAYTLSIPATGFVAGRGLFGYRSLGDRYLLGFAVAALAGLIMFGPMWRPLLDIVGPAIEHLIPQITQTGTMLGYHPEAAQAQAEEMAKIAMGLSRLIPAVLVMTVVTQFTVGFLWFAMRELPPEESMALKNWRMPFWLAPVMIVVIMGRLLGGETITLIADNLLFVLSIYYSVGGLAMMEYRLSRMGLPTWVKAVWYISLTIVGLSPIGLALYGFFVLLGFIDSFVDFRKIPAEPIELKKK